MQIRHRHVLLFLILATVIGVAVFALRPDDAPTGASKAVARNAASSNATATPPSRIDKADPPGTNERSAEIATALPARAGMADAQADLFGSQSWRAPSPKAAAAPLPPPPAPSAPAMLYRYAGRVAQDGQLRVFVSRGDAAPIAIKAGDTLDGGYVVEAITASAITLVYLPLRHRESIAIPPMADGAVAPVTPQR